MRNSATPVWADVRTKGETRPVRKVGAGFGVLGWTFIGLLGAALGVAAFYFQKRTEVAEARLAAVQPQLDEANARVAEAERRAALAREELERARREFIADRQRLAAERDQASQKSRALADELGKLVASDEGGVTRGEDGRLTLELVDRLLFPSGEAVLTPQGEKVLKKVAELLKKNTDQQVWIHGHTDTVPISNETFESNWELSAARALTVVHYLQEAGIEPRRLAAVGMGQYRPISKNKARNRRIEIVLFPEVVKIARN